MDFLWENITHAPFWIAVAQIIGVNIILSGDNAVVIALACMTLPPRQRLWGMILGAGVAVLLRVLFTLVVAQKRVRISREQAETFYAVHRERPFFRELVEFMISGPVVVQVLEGENAIAKYRDIMGATDPAKANAGTIRKVHAQSIGENSVHGSDAADTAVTEIAYFFSGLELVG